MSSPNVKNPTNAKPEHSELQVSIVLLGGGLATVGISRQGRIVGKRLPPAPEITATLLECQLLKQCRKIVLSVA